MSTNTAIEWTDHTFNPWHGCTKVSPGCTNCYANRLDDRHLYDDHGHWGPGAPRLALSEANWKHPVRWNRAAARRGERAMVFCASMADIFDKEAPKAERARLWPLIEATPNLDWQILTKRPERILKTIPAAWRSTPPENVWFGTSVENADYTKRVDALRQVPAVVRFLSVEPMLGPIVGIDMDGIGWVIAGGESGPGARPMQAAWVRGLRDQCVAARVPFFFKQWGQHNAEGVRQRSKHDAGRILDCRTWDQFPLPGKPMPAIVRGVK